MIGNNYQEFENAIEVFHQKIAHYKGRKNIISKYEERMIKEENLIDASKTECKGKLQNYSNNDQRIEHLFLKMN